MKAADDGSRMQQNNSALHHEQVALLLPAYVTAVVLGQPLDDDVTVHLAQCYICRSHFNELLAFTRAAYRGDVFAADPAPRWRLDFLPANQRSVPWSVNEQHQLVVQFSPSLLAQIRQSEAALLARGANTHRFELVEAFEQKLKLTIEIQAHAHPSNAQVEVMLDLSSRSPLSQDGSLITITAAEHTWQGFTDQSGYVNFNNIPMNLLPELRFTVTPSWEDA
jgi:hypothetical protein